MSARLQEDEYTDEEDDDGIQESFIPCIRYYTMCPGQNVVL